MKLFETARNRFDSVAEPGVAEARAVRNVNTSKALGYRGLQLAGLVSVFVFAGGFRHAEGSVEHKVAGGIGAIADSFTGVAQNSQGNWDMPFFDVPGFDFDGNENIVTLQQETTDNITEFERTASNGIVYDPTVGDRFYETVDDFAVCSGATESIAYDGAAFISDVILTLNPELYGNKAAALNVAYNEFEDELNPGINADSVPAGATIILPTDCRLQ